MASRAHVAHRSGLNAKISNNKKIPQGIFCLYEPFWYTRNAMEHDESSAPAEEHILDFEPEDELGALGAAKAKVQKLREELERAKKERQEYLDGWQRAKADAANAQKHAREEAERQKIRIREDFSEDVFPVLDSFDMAAGSESWKSVDATWRAGMEQVRNQLLDVLARHGMSRFGAVGEAYDPHLHEAVQEIEDTSGESGTIARILRAGYKSSDRVVRPAQVIVKR